MNYRFETMDNVEIMLDGSRVEFDMSNATDAPQRVSISYSDFQDMLSEFSRIAGAFRSIHVDTGSAARGIDITDSHADIDPMTGKIRLELQDTLNDFSHVFSLDPRVALNMAASIATLAQKISQQGRARTDNRRTGS